MLLALLEKLANFVSKILFSIKWHCGLKIVKLLPVAKLFFKIFWEVSTTNIRTSNRIFVVDRHKRVDP